MRCRSSNSCLSSPLFTSASCTSSRKQSFKTLCRNSIDEPNELIHSQQAAAKHTMCVTRQVSFYCMSCLLLITVRCYNFFYPSPMDPLRRIPQVVVIGPVQFVIPAMCRQCTGGKESLNHLILVDLEIPETISTTVFGGEFQGLPTSNYD